ncbi:PIG-L deacetylase family protein [Saccharothrix longispora]|uniref:PIG-L deacetylase family protein n=1 Tax=Saccharothrix longispora TaxID=33920 RepID=UPI0028FD57DB|nr:PIG-L deacetylase family protein [Saccharothrix longispora]MDU0291020.1 PIG-L deacetylase family protein [Saccharothrix longispora]
MTERLKDVPEDFTRVLCVVAHPDDIEFSGAGAVAAWTAAGKEVAYVLVTRGEAGIDGLDPAESAEVREREQRASAELVGVKEVEFLDGHRDGVVEEGVALRRDLAAAIRRHRPELVVGYNHRDETFTNRWNSADHRAVGRALLDAVADAGNRWIFPEAGERWAGVRHVAMLASPRPTHAVDVSGSVDLAVASLEAHRAYLDALGATDVRTPLTGLFEANGRRYDGRPAITLEFVSGG